MYLDVSCAIIEHEEKVLAVQRSAHMDNSLLWEFPGGKVETGETAAESIVREIKEELGIGVQLVKALRSAEHLEKGRAIRLLPFICRWESGTIHLHEHAAARWMKPDRLLELAWCPADVQVIEDYLKNRT